MWPCALFCVSEVGSTSSAVPRVVTRCGAVSDDDLRSPRVRALLCCLCFGVCFTARLCLCGSMLVDVAKEVRLPWKLALLLSPSRSMAPSSVLVRCISQNRCACVISDLCCVFACDLFVSAQVEVREPGEGGTPPPPPSEGGGGVSPPPPPSLSQEARGPLSTGSMVVLPVFARSPWLVRIVAVM